MGRGHSASFPSSVLSSPAPSLSLPDQDDIADLDPPFPHIPSLPSHHIRLVAYDLLFSSCRSSPGFGVRVAPSYHDDPSPPTPSFSPHKSNAALNSRTKRVLGLKRQRSSPRSSPRRPNSLAELVRIQMRVPEQHDNRLRKTITRALVGQVARRPESILLPLEHLRHLRPSDFADSHEHHTFQRHQLRVLEVALLSDDPNPGVDATRLREIVRLADQKPIDSGKNSETMKALCSCATALACRASKQQPDACHWADTFPLNIHLYVALLQSIFDPKDESFVVDEVDELLELIKRTWPSLGMNRAMHNVCLAWVFFQQFVLTGQVEQELLCATLAMVTELGSDARRAEKDHKYAKALAGVLSSMQRWAEKRLMDYHGSFGKGTGSTCMENVLTLALSVAEHGGGGRKEAMDKSGSRVDYFIRTSIRNAFNRILEENHSMNCSVTSATASTEKSLFELAKETEELAAREKEYFSPILRRWHPTAAGIAAATLHGCYGAVLRQYLTGVAGPTREAIGLLQAAGKLEKMLVQTVTEDTSGCDDGTCKEVAKEVAPYHVEAMVVRLVRNWIEERLKAGRECLNRAKEIETWSPKSKSEAYAQSAVDLLKLAKNTVDEFTEIPITGHDQLVHQLADGLELLLLDYTSFVASCGTKESYLPTLPPLTRCNQDSALRRFWRCASPCRIHILPSSPPPPPPSSAASADNDPPRPSTSRGTQRLYVRLNTLHFLLDGVQQLDLSLAAYRRRGLETARAAAQEAAGRVAEAAAWRLMFLDSARWMYEGLYCGGVEAARVDPAARALKQNLSVMAAVLPERAREAVAREILRAAFEAFLLVLVAGGPDRAFLRSDHEMVMEDLKSLKHVFITCGENLVPEDIVDREAEVVEGIVYLMSLPTEQLIDDFSIANCEASGVNVLASTPEATEQKVPMPPTTGRWNRTDPNTILRVLCHRDEEAADRFLKRAFQLPRRR